MCLVNSRVFGFEIDGVKTGGLVPFADMLNHKYNENAKVNWYYSDSQNGFLLSALENCKLGDEVFNSYGKKCNSRFFMNYGFVLENNMENQVKINFILKNRQEIEFYEEKVKLLMNEKMLIKPRSLRLSRSYDCKNTRNAFGYLRFLEVNSNKDLQALKNHFESSLNIPRDFKPETTPVISLDNEKNVIEKL